MTEMQVQVVIQIDATQKSAAEAVEYYKAFVAGVTGQTEATVTAGPIFGLDKQLGRLTDHNPIFAPRVRKLHDELVNLGYVPTLPKSQKKELPSYISYVDPANGVNLGNLNSQTFYVMRGSLRAQLVALPAFTDDGRYAKCQLVDEAAVGAVLKVAEDEKK